MAPIDVTSFAANSIIPRAAAVRLIADRTRRPSDSECDVRNRVSKRITYAVKNGKLSPATSGTFEFGELMRWAATWNGRFGDLPRNPNSAEGQVTISLLSVSGYLYSLPNDLPQCHAEINRLHAQMQELRAKLEAIGAENAQLRRRFEIAEKRAVRSKEGGRGRAK